MTRTKKWLLGALLGTAAFVCQTAAGQIVAIQADLQPAVGGRPSVTEVAYRPYYARRAYYGGYYQPYRAYYGSRAYGYGYGYGERWGSYYRPYYSNRAYGYPAGYGWYGSRPYYGYCNARPAYTYGRY